MNKDNTISRQVIIITVLFVVLLILLFLSGCGNTSESPYFYEGSSGRFNVIESQPSYTIVVDTQTGVEYLMTKYGKVTVLVDKDGKPLLADGGREEG